jgi:hypothetical protein
MFGWPVDAVVPPSTVSVAPVMYPASALARNSTAGAMSSGSPGRPSAIRSTNGASTPRRWGRSRFASVRVNDGATASRRTPRAP